LKALSIRQPWLDLILSGQKTIETRSWSTDYLGPLLLCASKTVDRQAFKFPHVSELFYQPKTGMALGTCRLVDCRPMAVSDEMAAMCGWQEGLYSWILSNVRPIHPFEVKGQLRLFEVEVTDEQLRWKER
jgi:hypothetical protein